MDRFLLDTSSLNQITMQTSQKGAEKVSLSLSSFQWNKAIFGCIAKAHLTSCLAELTYLQCHRQLPVDAQDIFCCVQLSVAAVSGASWGKVSHRGLSTLDGSSYTEWNLESRHRFTLRSGKPGVKSIK